MAIKQSVCYPILRLGDMTLDRLFGICADIGYSAVEMWGRGDAFEEVVGFARKHNLAVASMVGHSSGPGALSKRSSHERIEAELRVSIDLAAEHGIPGLICLSGNRQPYQTDLE
ncbi:MAG: sugar phosphate isomerase/epimerase, partial [Chloroflexi bacterium]|nr:sugar phosphate isomerase/epimerase [Chloroflexota bacterium]